MFHNLETLIRTAGYLGLFGIVFAESGLFFGFFFPGDSLLLTAGLLASRGYLNLLTLIPLCIIAAIGGDSVGYWMGKKFGRKLFQKEDSLFFKKKHLHEAENFYEKHGGKTIVIARFLPIIRTFAPIVAGIAQMDYSRFISFNVFGGIFWVLATTLGGYILGAKAPEADKYFHIIVIVVIIVSLIPSFIHFGKDYFKSRKASTPEKS